MMGSRSDSGQSGNRARIDREKRQKTVLADDVLAIEDRAIKQPSRGVFNRLVEEIPKAARFTVAQEVVASVPAILAQPMRTQLRALQLCRLPFRSTWFEWNNLWDNRSRVGVLVQTEDINGQRGSILFAERQGGDLRVWPLVMMFDCVRCLRAFRRARP